MAKKVLAPLPALALTPARAAAALDMGPDHFNSEVRPELRVIRRGRKTLTPVAELERWVAENAGRPVAEEVAA